MSLLWPAYLAGLAALGLPWLLHRFSRTDPPERPFPSKQFLEPAEPPVSRERKLRYRGLFALRVLLLIVLCLLFAEPRLRTAGASDGAGRHHLIVVDTSLSQRFGERWQRTQAAGRAAIDAVPVGHSLQLFAADTVLNTLTEATTDKAAVQAALSNLQPGRAAVDYGELMQRLDVVAARSELPVVATLITDAQRRSLPKRLGSLTARALARLTIVDVAKVGERNDFLTASARTSDEVYARVAVTVGSSVAGVAAGSEGGAGAGGGEGDGGKGAAVVGSGVVAGPVTRQVTVSHAGRVLATENVTLSAGETRTLWFDRIAMPAVEVVKLDVAFADRDALPDDDSMTVIVRQPTPVDVGIRAIDTPLPTQAPVFIATALETDDVARIIEAPATQGLSDELQHAIVFADLGDRGQVPVVVEQFVRDGGNVLLVDVSAMRQAVAFDRPQGIGLIDEAHPLALGTLDWYQASWYGASRWASRRSLRRAVDSASPDGASREVADALRVNAETDQGAAESRVLLQMASGTPILVERRLAPPGASTDGLASSTTGTSADSASDTVIGDGSRPGTGNDVRLDDAGRLLIISDPLDGELSDFPLQPAFVGFMQRLVEYFEISSAIPERLNAGNRLVLPANVQVLDAAGERLFELGGADSGQSLKLDTPGLYNVISQQGSHWLEVVIDAGESDMATVPPAELQAWEARHAPRQNLSGDDVRTLQAGVDLPGSDDSLGLWRWLLPLGLALVVGESLFANRRLDVRRDGS